MLLLRLARPPKRDMPVHFILINKGVERNSMSSLTGIGKDHHYEKPIEPLENPSFKKVWAGLSKVKESDGKRKA